MQFKKALALALVVLGTSAFLLPFMVSAAGWSSPFALGSGSLKPAVAVDDAGNQHYVWWNDQGKIQYSKCTGQGGNGCSKPKDLSPDGASYYPSIALDPQGRPNVVFESKVSDGNSYAVFWTRKQGSNWSSPKKISSEPYSELPDIAIGPGGVIHVVYQSKQGNTGYVYYTKSNGGFEFDAPTELDSSPSDAPLAEFGALAELGKMPEAMEGSKISNGLYPRVAADSNDDAHVVWNMPSPYGIKYRYQNGGSWGDVINVASGKKDQTPDVAVSPSNAVGILWSTYNNFNASFAEYNNGTKDNGVNDIDGGLAQSLWPKISSDCAGNFHFVFQGSVAEDSKWNIYYRSYNPSSNNLGARQTIAKIAASEQTPAIDVRSVAAIVYNNSTNGIIDASTANLNLNCSSATATPTLTPSATNTPDPNATPTNTPTATNTPGDVISIANTTKCASYDGTEEGCIHYRKPWKKYTDSNATNGNYQRCDDGGICAKRSAAKIYLPGGYTKVKWFTAKAKTYGKVNVFINDVLKETLDMCQGSSGVAPKFVTLTYDLPERTDGLPRTFEIGAPGKHTTCSPYNSNYVTVDGFEILP